jgi:squalene-hopene/tetraprenyl-beta-curcumene cyclase
VNKKNPVYGTAKVCVYLIDCLKYDSLSPDLSNDLIEMISLAQNFLLFQQNADGSWGGEKGTTGSIEETSLAISALALNHKEACMKGFEWLKGNTSDDKLKSAPIGLYFAMLWYDEKMYPLVYYIESLRRYISK